MIFGYYFNYYFNNVQNNKASILHVYLILMFCDEKLV
jgi:hypothetical protein